MNDDLIRRGELAEEVKSLTVYVNGLRAGKGVLQEYAKQYRDSLLRIIDEQPAVDAVAVVRCKDCKWRNTAGCPYMNFDAAAREDSDFCSDGERRTNNGEIQKETR